MTPPESIKQRYVHSTSLGPGLAGLEARGQLRRVTNIRNPNCLVIRTAADIGKDRHLTNKRFTLGKGRQCVS